MIFVTDDFGVSIYTKITGQNKTVQPKDEFGISSKQNLKSVAFPQKAQITLKYVYKLKRDG